MNLSIKERDLIARAKLWIQENPEIMSDLQKLSIKAADIRVPFMNGMIMSYLIFSSEKKSFTGLEVTYSKKRKQVGIVKTVKILPL